MERKDKKNFYILYSISFIILMCVFLFFFIVNGKTLINASGDGYRQNYRALLYYSSYIKEIFNNLFTKHKLIIPMWDFSIGEGSDIFQTLLIDTIGGPIDFLSCLIPNNYIYLYHDFSIILRLYLAGISFSFLFIDKKETNYIGLLLGTITYVFCAYSYLQATNFFFFLKPLIEAPLIIVGVEKVINKESPFLLIFSVALTIIFNFYSAYIIGVVIAIYTIIRLLLIEDFIKSKSIILIKIVAFVFIGVLLSAIVLMPAIYSFVGNVRLSNQVSYPLFYSFREILSILSSFVVNDFLVRLFGGYSLICLFSMFLLFSRKGNKLYKVLLIVSMAFLFSPCLQRLFNAMSYPTERWVWAFSLLISCVVTKCYDYFYEIGRKIYILLIIFCLYSVVCIYADYEDIKLYILVMIIGIATLFFIRFVKNKKMIDFCTVGITLLCISINLFNYLSPYFWNQTYKFSTIEEALNYNENESQVLNSIDDNSFWRYDGDLLTTNSSMQNRYHATNFYWSCVNNYVSEFRKNLGLLDHNSFHYDNYNERYSLMNLASVKYYIDSDTTNALPFGYEGLGNGLYVNNNSLPMIYAYDSTISKEEWYKLDVITKQESLLQSAVVDSKSNSIINPSAVEMDFIFEKQNDLNISNNIIDVKNNGGSFQLVSQRTNNGEHYIVIEGLDIEYIENEKKQLNITISTEKGYKKTIGHKDKTHTRYSNRHDYVVNIGYYDETIDRITISFDSVGKYSYKNIRYVCIPMDEQMAEINKLNCVTINSLNIGNNIVESNITIDDNKMVCFSIPYSKGWAMYIDDIETNVENINIMYLGANISKGNHSVKLVYKTPYIFEGIIISAMTLIGIIFIHFYNRKSNRQSTQ